MIDYIGKKLFSIDEEDNGLHAQWMRYYIEYYLVGIQKFLEVLFFSFLFRTILETVLVSLCLILLRSFAKGWHALTKIGCSIQNILFYVLFPSIIVTKGFVLTTTHKLLITFFVILVFLLYAPQGTKKEPVPETLKPLLKLKAVLSLFCLVFISYFISENSATLVYYAICIQVIMIIPLSKKIITGDVYNELFEKIFKKKTK